MGGPLYVTLSGIYMNKMENDIVAPTKLVDFVGDIYNMRKKNTEINYIIHLIIIIRTLI